MAIGGGSMSRIEHVTEEIEELAHGTESCLAVDDHSRHRPGSSPAQW